MLCTIKTPVDLERVVILRVWFQIFDWELHDITVIRLGLAVIGVDWLHQQRAFAHEQSRIHPLAHELGLDEGGCRRKRA